MVGLWVEGASIFSKATREQHNAQILCWRRWTLFRNLGLRFAWGLSRSVCAGPTVFHQGWEWHLAWQFFFIYFVFWSPTLRYYCVHFTKLCYFKSHLNIFFGKRWIKWHVTGVFVLINACFSSGMFRFYSVFIIWVILTVCMNPFSSWTKHLL